MVQVVAPGREVGVEVEWGDYLDCDGVCQRGGITVEMVQVSRLDSVVVIQGKAREDDEEVLEGLKGEEGSG